MSILLDLLGSVIIAGYVIFIGLSMNMHTSDATTATMTRLTVQESLGDFTSQIESDLKKIGYGVADPTTAIVAADSTNIIFLGDIDKDGTVDSVRCYIGEMKHTTQVTGTVRSIMNWLLGGGNTNVVTQSVPVYGIYRTINGGPPAKVARNITTWRLRYFNQSGQPTFTPSQIATIEISVGMTSTHAIRSEVNPDSLEYAKSFWRQTRLSTRNMKRHG